MKTIAILASILAFGNMELLGSDVGTFPPPGGHRHHGHHHGHGPKGGGHHFGFPHGPQKSCVV